MVTLFMCARLLPATFGTSRALFTRMTTTIAKLTDADLIARLRHTCREASRLLGELIRLLIEVERRRIYLEKAYPSLFEFCRKELRMSEGEAYRRINAARLVARFSQLLPYIERGDIHLTALLQLRDHFTENNVDDLVASAKGRNKMQVAELVARLAPRPDVPAKLRKLPQHDTGSRMTKASRPSIDPLSEARYRLQVTGSRHFRDKLLRARDLMMHSNPSGDLSVVIERAVDELLDILEKRVFGKLSRTPPKKASETSSPSEDALILAAESSDRPSSTKKQKKWGDDARHPGIARTSTDSHEKRGGAPARARRVASPRVDAGGDLRQRKPRYENGEAPAAKRSASIARSVSAPC